MRAFDAHAITQCSVPGLLLMENAGRGATDVLVRELCGGDVTGARPVIVCGAGNNGGDGLVVARHLLVRGASPIVFFAGDADRMTDDARANFEAWRGLGGEIQWLPPGTPLSTLERALEGGQVVVDALFGTGLDRPVEGWLARVIEAINGSRGERFAIDLPSGLDTDTGAALGVAVEASVTATFAHYKLGLLTPNGASLAGRVHVIDIGVPSGLVAHVGGSAQRLEAHDVPGLIARRPPGAHKTSAGHVAVVAGSHGRIGAPQLSARGALRAGAGVATIVTWPDAANALQASLLEVMSASIAPPAIGESLDAILKGKHAVVVGPGLGLGEEARIAVEYILAAYQGPVVVDADALSMFAGRPSVLLAAKNAVLTPHPGEAAKLLGKTTAQIEGNRFMAARELVAATGAVVVLKGAHTIVAAPDSRLAISPISAPVLATAGSGDVLSGIIGALACTMSGFDAACAGVMLHALAGEAWSRAHAGADRGMLAHEIADSLAIAGRPPSAAPPRG
jgi:NAD(P)H-hydrate epimerase